MLTVEDAAVLDRQDPPPTDAFDIPDGVVYLDGNSLGPRPSNVSEVIRSVVDEEWAVGLIRSWNDADWVGLPRRVGHRIERLIGADPGTVVACDSTSVNLYKAVGAAMRLAEGPRVILTDDVNFPSDLYVMASLAEREGWRLEVSAPELIAGALADGVGVLAVTQVDYRSGARHDMADLTRRAHEVGALTVWDLAHSAGAFSVDLEAAGADFAVGCGYKYLNGGPGAPAFVYAAARHHPAMDNPITGWFGHRRPFDFDLTFEPAPGIDRMRIGTSHVLSLAALDAALEVFDEVDLEQLFARGRRLVQALFDGFETLGLDVITPAHPDHRGSQVAFRHPRAYAIVQGLIDRGVIGDFRAPDVARFGLAPLYLTYIDIATALVELRDVLAEEDLDRLSSRRGAVT